MPGINWGYGGQRTDPMPVAPPKDKGASPFQTVAPEDKTPDWLSALVSKPNGSQGVLSSWAGPGTPADKAPASNAAVTQARGQVSDTAQQWQRWGSFGDFFDFWDGWDSLDIGGAAKVWNQLHPNDPVQAIGHSGDAVRYRGEDWDGIENVGSSNQKKVRLFRPNANTGGGGDMAAGGGSTYGNSASTDLYVQQILSRLLELHKPINDPFRTVANKTALEQAGHLMQDAPYTAGEDAALTAHYREPLTQARDAAMQRNAEIASARGFGSSHGGIADIANRHTEADYEHALAGGANDLAVRAVDEKRSRQTQALNIVMGLVEQDRQRRAEENAQASELLRDSALLPGLDESRVRLLLDATSDQGSTTNSMISQLAGLMQNAQSQSRYNDANNSQDDAAIGAAIARIISGMGN